MLHLKAESIQNRSDHLRSQIWHWWNVVLEDVQLNSPSLHCSSTSLLSLNLEHNSFSTHNLSSVIYLTLQSNRTILYIKVITSLLSNDLTFLWFSDAMCRTNESLRYSLMTVDSFADTWLKILLTDCWILSFTGDICNIVNRSSKTYSESSFLVKVKQFTGVDDSRLIIIMMIIWYAWANWWVKC